jgi:hypothetical protein
VLIRTVFCLSRYTHPEALPGFRTPELGRQFREAAYARHGIKMPSRTPQTITVLTNVGAEQVRGANRCAHNRHPWHTAARCKPWWTCYSGDIVQASATTLVRTRSRRLLPPRNSEPAHLQVTNLDDFVDVMDDVGRAFGYRTRPLSMTLGIY